MSRWDLLSPTRVVLAATRTTCNPGLVACALRNGTRSFSYYCEETSTRCIAAVDVSDHRGWDCRHTHNPLTLNYSSCGCRNANIVKSSSYRRNNDRFTKKNVTMIRRIHCGVLETRSLFLVRSFVCSVIYIWCEGMDGWSSSFHSVTVTLYLCILVFNEDARV